MSENIYLSIPGDNVRQRHRLLRRDAETRRERTYPRPAVRPARQPPGGAKRDQGDRQWRLGDKILDAFTYAYSAGDTEIAAHLRAVLTRLENRAEAARPLAHVPLTEQADRWTAFVAARNAYTALLEQPDASEAEREVAFHRMKARYLRWSDR